MRNPEESDKNRSELIKTKRGAIACAFIELEGLINQSQFTKEYFGKSQAWFTQKLHGSKLPNAKYKPFDSDEASRLAEAFRHIAKRLNAHADEIDAASE